MTMQSRSIFSRWLQRLSMVFVVVGALASSAMLHAQSVSDYGNVQESMEALQGDNEITYDSSVLNDWAQSNSFMHSRFSDLLANAKYYPQEIAATFSRINDPARNITPSKTLIYTFVVLLVGILVEWLLARIFLVKLYRRVALKEPTTWRRIVYIITRFSIQFIALGTIVTVLYRVGNMLFMGSEVAVHLFNFVVTAYFSTRLWLIILRNVFAPRQSQLRPIKLDNKSAGSLYIGFGMFFGVLIIGQYLFDYFRNANMNELLLSGLVIPYTLVMNVIIVAVIWRNKSAISGMFTDARAIPVQENPESLTFFLKKYWLLLFSAWLLVNWVLWNYNAFTGNWALADNVSVSWYITIAFPVVDRLFHAFLVQISKIPWLQSARFEKRSCRFIRNTQNAFRFVAFLVAFYAICKAWGLESSPVLMVFFHNSTNVVIELALTLTLTYIVWELILAIIERKLPEEDDNALASLEGDAGGEGATRAETLLPLVKTVMLVVLVILGAFSILHSMGVAIGPLLAGAGVVGIAVGFGAQKLVQDILSGIFFLIDDAFRKGEYIEIEELRGTVEKISLRSMQLRHHLGAVQTIPYGEVKTVKNLSRDWVTMKLELRLPYDVDIEQVRKIIKKTGQRMLEDEELGPAFILPLKSQGVMRVEESALIVRMKFTTKPGEQWVVRREAYRQVRDALADAGINFAHREVRVRIPEELERLNKLADAEHGEADSGTAETAPHTSSISQQLGKAAAAAAGSVLAAEALKQGRLDDDDGNDM